MADSKERTEGLKTNAAGGTTNLAYSGHVCPHCNGLAEGRNLVVCIDGTSNKFSINNTNIVELYRHLKSDDSQFTYYNSGIGTHARPSYRSFHYWKQAINHNIDLAFAWNFEKIVLGAYRWLADNYRNGDKIYLFGFSRGAYQVRVLSAMIDKVGLIRRGNEEQIPFAFEVYAALPNDEIEAPAKVKVPRPGQPRSDGNPATKSSSGYWSTLRKAMGTRTQAPENIPKTANLQVNAVDSADKSSVDQAPKSVLRKKTTVEEDSLPRKKARAPSIPETIKSDFSDSSSSSLPEADDGDPVKLAETFKETFSRDSVKVHFVGAWDTVSSVGFVRDKVHPHTANGMKHVCYFRHALALDECRVKFLPEYAYGGTTLPRSSMDGSPLILPGDTTKPPYKDDQPHIKEVWFCGTHSDIGGGNAKNVDLNRGDPPLRWMSYEAVQAGLMMSSFDGSKFEGWDTFKVNRSMTGMWWMLEILPLRRLSYRDDKRSTSMPNFGRGRQIKPGQLIHNTVIRDSTSAPSDDKRSKAQRKYKPRAVMPKELRQWNDYRQNERLGERKKEYFIGVERDLLNLSESLVSRLRERGKNHTLLEEYKDALRSVEHSRALYDLSKRASGNKDKAKQGGSSGKLSLKPTRQVLSSSFKQLVSSSIKRPVPLPNVSISIQPDIRLYALCIRLFGLTPPPPISELRLEPDPSSESDPLRGDSEVYFAVDKENQNLEITFMGPAFQRACQDKLIYLCTLDDTKTVATVLRRASQFFSNLRGQPPAADIGVSDPPEEIVRHKAQFKRIDAPVGAKTWEPKDLRNDEGVFTIGTKGEVFRALYNCTIWNDEKTDMYVYVLSFEPDLGIDGTYETFGLIESGKCFSVTVRSRYSWSTKHTTVYKVVLTDKEVPDPQSFTQEYIGPGEIRSKMETWKAEQKDTPFVSLPSRLSELGITWTTYQFSVTQDSNEACNPSDGREEEAQSTSDATLFRRNSFPFIPPQSIMINESGATIEAPRAAQAVDWNTTVIPPPPAVIRVRDSSNSRIGSDSDNASVSDQEPNHVIYYPPPIGEPDTARTPETKQETMNEEKPLREAGAEQGIVLNPQAGETDAVEPSKSQPEAPVRSSAMAYLGLALGMFSG